MKQTQSRNGFTLKLIYLCYLLSIIIMDNRVPLLFYIHYTPDRNLPWYISCRHSHFFTNHIIKYVNVYSNITKNLQVPYFLFLIVISYNTIHLYAAGLWFSPSTCSLVSSNNKTDRHVINEILLKVELNQTWGQLLSNVIDYITITLQFSWLHYIMITSIFKCNQLNYNYFVNVIDYITDYI